MAGTGTGGGGAGRGCDVSNGHGAHLSVRAGVFGPPPSQSALAGLARSLPSLLAGDGISCELSAGRNGRFQRLPGDFKCSSNTKSRAVGAGGGSGGGTVPRPSFTNYAEYPLTGGLSPCLLSRPTTLPLFRNIPSLPYPAWLQACRGLRRGSRSSARTSRRAEETKESGVSEGVGG